MLSGSSSAGPGRRPRHWLGWYGFSPTLVSNESRSSSLHGSTGGSGTGVLFAYGVRSNTSRLSGIQCAGEGARRRRFGRGACVLVAVEVEATALVLADGLASAASEGRLRPLGSGAAAGTAAAEVDGCAGAGTEALVLGPAAALVPGSAEDRAGHLVRWRRRLEATLKRRWQSGHSCAVERSMSHRAAAWGRRLTFLAGVDQQVLWRIKEPCVSRLYTRISRTCN